MKKVYLSPSNQTDNVGFGNYGTEKQRMTQLVELTRQKLINKFDVKVANYDSTLASRASEANNWNADIYVAFHTNAGGSRGCEVYAYSKASKGNELANLIYKRISAITPSADRGVKYNSLYETRMPNTPACLIEFIFHDNKEDVEWFLNNMDQVATETAKAICEYFNESFEETTKNEIKKDEKTENKKIGKIAKIQADINKKYGLKIAVDNEYGVETKKALILALQHELNVQFKKSLKEDGIFGNLTKNACVNIEKGDEGNITYIIQACLICKNYNLEADGIFGNETEKAVKDFQNKNKLTVDGIVGKNTFEKLFL